MKKYFVIDGNDKVYTEREFSKLSPAFKGRLNRCIGTFKNRKEAEKAWNEEIWYGQKTGGNEYV